MMDSFFYSVLNWRKALGVLGRDYDILGVPLHDGWTVQGLVTTWDMIAWVRYLCFFAPASAGIGIFRSCQACGGLILIRQDRLTNIPWISS